MDGQNNTMQEAPKEGDTVVIQGVQDVIVKKVRRKRKRSRHRGNRKDYTAALRKYDSMPESLLRPIVDNGHAGVCQQIADNLRDSLRMPEPQPEEAEEVPEGESA